MNNENNKSNSLEKENDQSILKKRPSDDFMVKKPSKKVKVSMGNVESSTQKSSYQNTAQPPSQPSNNNQIQSTLNTTQKPVRFIQ
jgi:hypothetical protein